VEGLTVRAVQIQRPGAATLVSLPDPTPAPDDVLVQVAACGVCGTDIHILDGEFPPSPYPIVPGHEAAGSVTAVGEAVRDIAVGTRVGMDPSLFCGVCRFCQVGRGNLCNAWGAIGDTRDGAMAEFVSVPRHNVYPLPDHISFEAAALIEPVSCAVHALDRFGITVGDEVLVCGAGTMGLIMASLIRAAGAVRVALVDVNSARLSKAQEMGFADSAESVAGLCADGTRFDKVLDATGVPAVIQAGIGAVRKGGTFLVFGVAPAGAPVWLEPFRIYNEEITVIGSMAVLSSYGRALEIVAHGLIDSDALITHRFPLEDYDAALHAARSGAGLKVQLLPAGS
jgi:2-desacetyl-2-hydroxyethyl bacteriochlorophyllide A dehydrogenase